MLGHANTRWTRSPLSISAENEATVSTSKLRRAIKSDEISHKAPMSSSRTSVSVYSNSLTSITSPSLKPTMMSFYCSISGFGQETTRGVTRLRSIALALGGIMNQTRYSDCPPVRIRASFTDCGTAARSVIHHQRSAEP